MDKSFLSRILIRNTCPSPDVVLCNDYYQSMYVQMLAGLYQRLQVVQIKSVFSYSLIQSVNFLRENWPQMVRDIMTGILTDKISDQTLRRSISDLLEKPDPDLANFIANQCSSSKDWCGIMTKIWPNTKCLRTIVTGSMSQYLPMLKFYSGGLPIVSLKYACSECYLGINLQPICDPLEVSYTLLPNMAYFEFMPQEPAEKGSLIELVDLASVEVGKEYELVVTTYAGLYRYQVGDILRVTGFHNAAPTFKFVRRKGLLLDICTEMTTEEALQKAVQGATELLKRYGVIVQDYTSHVDVVTTPGHYVIYLELTTREGWGLPGADVLEKCCFVMEEAFNKGYKYFRVSGRIGPLEIRAVSDGTFKKLMDYAVSGGAAVTQYKVPRCVKLPHILELLNSQVISAHFSQACPHWSPQQSW